MVTEDDEFWNKKPEHKKKKQSNDCFENTDIVQEWKTDTDMGCKTAIRLDRWSPPGHELKDLFEYYHTSLIF